MSLKDFGSVKWFGIAILALGLMACSKSPRPENEIRLGIIAGPEARLMEAAAKIAHEQYGLDIKLIEFEDYVTPNTALAEGSLDANMYQHAPYLEAAASQKGYDFHVKGRTFIYPMGAYSLKWSSLSDLPKRAKIGIPNDPSNGARALRLLASEGLIKLPEGPDLSISVNRLLDNPKQLQFKPMDPAQLPRVLEDLDMAIINTTFALPAGLTLKESIAHESSESPYANILVIRSEDTEVEKYAQLLAAMRSEVVVRLAGQLFHDQAIKAW